jgi:hypothetical protein
MKSKLFQHLLLGTMILALALFLQACSEDDPLAPIGDTTVATTGDPFADAMDKGMDIDSQDGSYVPADLVTIDCFGEDLTFWPFTGAKLDGVPMDPVNLVFAGNADPLQIRAALLGLSSDRSILNLPDVYPFNQQWKDALGGGVQANYAEDGGWLGSVIQLTLGDYGPIRFHLRLFRTNAYGPNGETYTIGATHFELQIPGTTDHQVLSWSVAKDIVVGDLMRSGLLNPSMHLRPTGQITPTPTFREIIPAIYNGLPDELIYMIGGPAKPVTEPVGIDNGDGTAMMIYLAGAAPVTAGTYTNSVTIGFDQYIPRPYCSEGPGDVLYITGPVDFQTSVVVDEYGVFSYNQGYSGRLTALPLNMSTGNPVGEPFTAKVMGKQHGSMGYGHARVSAFDQKMTHDAVGPQMQVLDIKIGETGKIKYRGFERCFEAD